MNPEQRTAADYLKTLPQYFLPHHLISRVTLALTRVRSPAFKNAFIQWFIRQYGVDMSLARNPDPTSYEHFNSFFTRALRDDARPIVSGEREIACPVDGAVSQLGPIEDDTLFQAKGHNYSLTALLGGDESRSTPFRNGSFATLYLSPRDYHRIHMPLAGQLKEMVYVPGRLFAVNQVTVKMIPGVFARNERVVAIFDTSAGPMAMAFVGAINVGCIETVWHGVVTPPTRPEVASWPYRGTSFNRGDEIARFNMGSTVIVLFGPGAVQWKEGLGANHSVRMGELLARHA